MPGPSTKGFTDDKALRSKGPIVQEEPPLEPAMAASPGLGLRTGQGCDL